MDIRDRKFWENYWYYYKYHTLAGIFALILIITTLYQCATTVKPDFSAIYIGNQYISEEAQNAAQSAIAEAVGDINKDGKKSALLMCIMLSSDFKSDMDAANLQKADLEISVGDANLVFATENMLKRYINMDVFADISERAAKAGIDQSLLVKDKDGKAFCAVEISQLPFGQKLGAKSKLYMAVRKPFENKKDDSKFMAQYNKSLDIFDAILNGNLK